MTTKSDIVVGLRVRALNVYDVSAANRGRIARVYNVEPDRIHYAYEHAPTSAFTVREDSFWARFKPLTDDKPRGVAATAGHCAGNGGLRGHSVGDIFPVVLYQRGNPEQLTHWLRLPDGRDIGPYYNADDAFSAAAWHKANPL